MGIESFYIKVECRSKSMSLYNTLINMNSIHVKKDSIFNNILYLNDMIKIYLTTDEEKIKNFSLEGCFSCFEQSLEGMFEFLKVIDKECCNIILKHPFESNLSDLNIESFILSIDKYYQNKHYHFSDTFGNLKFISKPGDFFYKKLPIEKLKHNIKKIWNKIKGSRI